MWAFLIVVSKPILHLRARIFKGEEPVGVQTFRSEAAIERFDIRVIGHDDRGAAVSWIGQSL